MPIVNYEQIAKRCEERLFNNNKISEVNKEYVKKFLDQYDVTLARKCIFLGRIIQLLEVTPDIKKDMLNKDKINKIFKEFRESSKSVTTYATLVNVSLRFVRWLNGDRLKGARPLGFMDLERVSKVKQKRALNPKDMITWADGKKIASTTTSIQLKALVLTQLDGGLRPSELLDLNYSDVEVKKDLVVLNVKGKTGARPVLIHRSAPAFLKWYYAHPTKKPNDPLWITENNAKGQQNYTIRRYFYPTICKRIGLLFKRAKINKPFDLYNFRHSSCVLDKKDNLPIELASSRHGHSVAHFTETYGRLSVDDIADRYRKHYGKEEQKEKPEENIVCEKCDFVNEPKAEVCYKCSSPLTLKRAIEVEDNFKKDIKKYLLSAKEGILSDIRKEIEAKVV